MHTVIRNIATVLSIGCLAALAVATQSASAQAQAAQPAPAQQAAPSAEAPPQLKQIALTEKQIEGLLIAQKGLDAITDKLPEGAADKPDPKLTAQFEEVVKKHGFASYAEYGQVVDNISLAMSGIDPKTKAFTDPPILMKKQIAALEAEKKMPAKDKQAALTELKEAAKYAVSVQFPENVKLVTKYYDKLAAALEEDQ